MHLLALHKIARSGDGLAPELQRLLSAVETQSTNIRVVPLRRFNPAIPEIAGAYRDRPEPHDVLGRTPSDDRIIQHRRPTG
jgi:hypothetical protein